MKRYKNKVRGQALRNCVGELREKLGAPLALTGGRNMKTTLGASF